jgi:hypothetical protein
MTTATLDRQDTDFESVVTLTILAGLTPRTVVELAEWARDTEPTTPMLDVVGRELRDLLEARRSGRRYDRPGSPLQHLER